MANEDVNNEDREEVVPTKYEFFSIYIDRAGPDVDKIMVQITNHINGDVRILDFPYDMNTTGLVQAMNDVQEYIINFTAKNYNIMKYKSNEIH